MVRRFDIALSLVVLACGKSSHTPSPGAAASPNPVTQQRPAPPVPSDPVAAPATSTAVTLVSKATPLPGVTGPLSIDYIAYDRRRARVWVPVAADTGIVEVFDVASGVLTPIGGLKTTERGGGDHLRKLGPNAVTLGDGVVYIGNRATREVCVVDDASLALGSCLELPTQTDGVAYVASTKEVWVTTPHAGSLTVLDASNPKSLKPKLVIKTPGEPEGYAVDEARGLFYTNLEDKNRTLVVAIRTHAIQADWAAGCDAAGPRGVAFDSSRQLVFVACTSGVNVIDGAHGGSIIGNIVAGAGVDNIDYLESKRQLYIAAARAATLTVARVDDKGQLSVITKVASPAGARNAVVDMAGNVYLADARGANLVVYSAH